MSNSQMRWSPFIWLLANHFFLKIAISFWMVVEIFYLVKWFNFIQKRLWSNKSYVILFEGRSTYA